MRTPAQASRTDWRAESIKLVPQVLWILLAIVAFFTLYQPVLSALNSGSVSKVSVVGVEIEFARKQFAKVPGLDNEKGTITNAAEFAPFQDRIERSTRKLAGARALWVDDRNPTQNFEERRAFQSIGIAFDLARSTTEAEQLLERADQNGSPYHLIISDIGRDVKTDSSSAACYPMAGSPNAAGCALLQSVQARYSGSGPPVIFYSAQGDAIGTPPGAFGVTNRLDHLLELVIDAAERRTDVYAASSAAAGDRTWDGTATAPSPPPQP